MSDYFNHLINQFFDWIFSYPPTTVALVLVAVIFIASVLESLPFTGMFLPSESLTILFGALAYKGIVDIKALIIAVYIGILLGDVLSYYIGKKVGEEFLNRHAKRLKIGSKNFQKIKKLLDDNLLKALFIGRSNGFTRWITPFLAGANGINLKKFILYNMLTAAFWSPTFLLGGYYLGSAFEIYGKYVGLGIIAIMIIGITLYKWIKRDKNDQ